MLHLNRLWQRFKLLIHYKGPKRKFFQKIGARKIIDITLDSLIRLKQLKATREKRKAARYDREN